MSLIVVEAGVLARPVLMTDQCGLDRLADLDAVRLVPATVEGLQGGLAALLDDAALCRRLGSRLNELILREYTWPTIAEAAGRFFRSVEERQSHAAE